MTLEQTSIDGSVGRKNKTEQRSITRFAMLALLLACGASLSSAQTEPGPVAPENSAAAIPVKANLNITPKRLTFKRGERSGTVYIYNQGTTPATFDISIVDRVMLPTGEIEALSQAQVDPRNTPTVSRLVSAKDLLIVTPRRAVLAAGKGQTVRIRVTAPATAQFPEYRAHLTVSTVPPRDVGVTADEAASAEQASQLSFRITSVFGISIPIIVHTGAPDIRASISDVHMMYSGSNGRQSRAPLLSLNLERSGANSVFGNIEVRSSKSKQPVGIARGIGVYPEIDKRLVYIPLQRAPAPGETLTISFVDDDVAPGRVVTRTTFVVP